VAQGRASLRVAGGRRRSGCGTRTRRLTSDHQTARDLPSIK
jgi:hypothetical protein